MENFKIDSINDIKKISKPFLSKHIQFINDKCVFTKIGSLLSRYKRATKMNEWFIKGFIGTPTQFL